VILLAVGTQFSFDRLTRAVDDALDGLDEPPEVFGQIGATDYRPRNFPARAILPRAEFLERLREAEAVISHAGIGILLAAAEHDKPLLVMPRRASLGEVVNDHQVVTAERFARRGQLLLARDETEIPRVLPRLSAFRPSWHATGRGELVRRVGQILERFARGGKTM
jgi:UDP-N-acetylglucosamine transferase subunit ALG13